MGSPVALGAGKPFEVLSPAVTPATPVALVLGALVVRLYQLGGASLWFDEAISWSVASTPWPDLLAARQEPHPPLYYAFLKLWMGLGTSETMLRLPTAAVGAVDVALVFALAAHWGGRRAGAVAGALVALSPLHVWYAREARMYEFVAAAAVGSTLLLAWWWSSRHPLALVSSVLATLAGLYLNYTMALVIAVQTIAVIGAGRWRRTLAFLAALAAVAVGYLPWLPTALGHFELVRGAHFQGYADRLAGLSGVAIAGDVILASLGAVPLLLLVLAAIFGRPAWSRLRQASAEPFGVAVLAIAPVALFAVLGDLPGGLTVKRQILVLAPLAVALAAVVVARQARWRLVLIGLVVLGLPGVWRGVVDHEIEPWRTAAAIVEAEAGPDDLVLIHVLYAEPAFRYYYHGIAPARPAPAGAGALPGAVGSARRVWLVLSRWQGPTDPIVVWLDRTWHLSGVADLSPLAVRVYERPAS